MDSNNNQLNINDITRNSNIKDDESLPLIYSINNTINNDISNDIHKDQFFHHDSFTYLLFSNTSKGRRYRFYLCILYATFFMTLAIVILKYLFEYNIALSFLIGSTTITTIGYGPLLNPLNEPDHNFLSAYFFFGIIPLLFMQTLVTNDISYEYSIIIRSQLEGYIRKGSSKSKAFHFIVFYIIGKQLLLLLCLIGIGAVLYSYYAKTNDWFDALFFSIASVAAVGYGSLDVTNDTGCYLVGIFCLICHYLVFLYIFPIVGSLWVITSDSTDSTFLRNKSSRAVLFDEDSAIDTYNDNA